MQDFEAVEDFEHFKIWVSVGMEYAVVLFMETNDQYNNWGFVMVMLALVMALAYLSNYIVWSFETFIPSYLQLISS